MRTGVTCVVPARLGSTRFLGKLLEPIFGKPVVVHTLERAAAAHCFDRVICATESPEIGAAAEAAGFDWVLTGEARNGTERIALALTLDLPALRDAGLIVNLQGDEPAFPAEGLRALCEALQREPANVHLLLHPDAPSPEEIANPNRVKVVVDVERFVTEFTRMPAPSATLQLPRLQMGAYGYHRDYLAAYAALPPSAAELELSHEMLRAPGLAPIRAHLSPVKATGASVDVPDDLIAAREAVHALENMESRLNKSLNNSLNNGLNIRPNIRISTELQPSLQGAPA